MTVKVGYKRRTERSARRTKLGTLALISLGGMLLFIGLLFLAAFICLRRDASGWFLPLCAYACCAVSAFPVGYITAKYIGKSGLLCGLLSSLPLCILLLILCLSLYGTAGSGLLIGTALMLLSGTFGGVTALHLRHRKRYR